MVAGARPVFDVVLLVLGRFDLHAGGAGVCSAHSEAPDDRVPPATLEAL